MNPLASSPLRAGRLAPLVIMCHACLAVSAQAHPDHHPAGHGLLHVLGSPHHLAPWAMAACLLLSAALLAGRRAARRVLVAAGAATLFVWILLWATHA